MFAPRSFLLTVYERGSVVLEDLSTRERVHVTDLEEIAAEVAGRLHARRVASGEASARQSPDAPTVHDRQKGTVP